MYSVLSIKLIKSLSYEAQFMGVGEKFVISRGDRFSVEYLMLLRVVPIERDEWINHGLKERHINWIYGVRL